MSRPFIIEIRESEADLKKRLQHAREAIHKEKLQMLWWLKSGQVRQQQEIGKRLGRDTSTVTRWLQKYRGGGLEELLQIRKAGGNERKINGEVLAELQQQLQNPAGFSSYGAIVEWLKQKHGLTVEYGTVYATVRYLLGAKLKQPRPQSHQQNEQAVETFKKTLVRR
ncbi:helix-turn-helix domain-containing protein [Chroococcidiopsis sp. CCNUC1]|uniref:helix-turn-helix domain-containing protein n=1 Tax=Chroococcidiopsis sp. CCNUC1 TaxID=2653189 RepID=UPI0020225C9F|nr:helix-turn-helix domain-containing protein [Chroococcidiopsis sp. CCNUC1]URD53382.1 helix-turn-helix domain-containing protein [Chroococcidiopsis sp. CCNUC1]